MKWIAIIFLFFTIHSVGQLTPAQEKTIDSLQIVIKNAKHDSTIINAWKQWDDIIYISDSELDLKLLEKISALSKKRLKENITKTEKIFFKKAQAFSSNSIGIIYFNQGNYSKSINYYLYGLKIYEELGNKKGISACLTNIGNIYLNQGNYSKSIDYYMRSLKIGEELGDKQGIAAILTNIGLIYEKQEDYPKVIDYYMRGLKIREELGDKVGIANILLNIGIAYEKQGDFTKASTYYKRSLKISEAIGYKNGISSALKNIGNFYQSQGDYENAMDNYKRSLKISEELEATKRISETNINIAHLYLRQNKSIQSVDYALRALNIAKEIGSLQEQRDASLVLFKSYKALGQHQKALEMHELFIQTRDSIESEENQKNVIRQEFKYKYEKEKTADSVANGKEKEIKNAEIARKNAELEQQNTEIKAKRNQQYALFGGLGLVILFSFFMYNRFRITQKQKKIIEEKEKETQHQKEIIEEKHKEITDSINYAERIQRSFLATTQLLSANLNDYFILFQPKDVVSGDFYWADKISNGNFLIAAADSTGHGVPGAIMSILNITSLENAVKEGATNPSVILNHSRKNIIERLKKDGSIEGGKDGMDCSLLSFDFKNNKLSFALANNPLWLVRNGECVEYKADKMPVGKHDRDSVPFTQQEIDLQKGDLIYIFTDGYADQFGGPKGKKFKYSNLQELLLENANLELETLNHKLSSTFSQWKGDLEQVDDVCIIGIRI